MNRKITLVLFFALINLTVFADKAKKNVPFKVAFYNCENYYDTINDPAIDDEEFLPTAASNWNAKRFATKKAHLAQVINEINPDVIGLAEIENKNVLEQLTQESAIKGSKYAVVHQNSPDKRGIDVGFLYKKSEIGRAHV